MRFGAMRVGVVLCCLMLLTAAGPARSAPSVQMWDLVRSGEWDLMVRSVERRLDPLVGAEGALVRPAGRFAIFVVDLTNRTDDPLAVTADDFVLGAGGDGLPVNLADSAVARTYAMAAGLTPFGDVVPPGATVTTVVFFDVDSQTGRLTLHFVPANQPIRIDECKCNLPSPVRAVSGG